MILLAFRNLFRNLRRTLAILLTIAAGCAVLFSFKGFIHGVLEQYREGTIHAHYGHGQIHPADHWIEETIDFSQFPEVNQVFPRINFPALLKHGAKTSSGLGQAIVAEKEATFFHGLNVEEGVPLTTEENGIVLGKGLAEALEVSPGDTVELLDHPFTVTGIFHTGSLDFDSKMFRIQLQAAQKLLQTDKVQIIALDLNGDWDSFKSRFEKVYPELKAYSFADLDKVYYQHSVDWLHAQFNVIQMIILTIVLLGIFNSISSAILERKQEIGNFRANGESKGDILRLITLEGTFLGFFGSVIGLSLAYVAMAHFLNRGIEMPPGPGLTRPFLITFKFEWPMVWTTLALCSISAVVAAFFASIRVAKMPIAKALRSA